MFFPMFDPLYWLIALPALVLGLYAQYKVRSAYEKYQRVRNANNMGGLEVAQRLLRQHGLYHVEVRETPGHLSDHYDPRRKALYLSAGVARSPSIAALGITAHEVGHAMQDHQQYWPLKVRSGLVPIVQIGSWLGPIVFLMGLVLPIPNLALVGLLLFSGVAIFSLVTLPVEMNASRRAVAMLKQSGLLSASEEQGVRAVLSAAALTYVAAAAQAISTLLYYFLLLSGGRRRRF